MSLSGFDHVFSSAIEVDLSAEMHIRVAPPTVTTLLKIIAYMDDPYRRAKDLQDIQVILGRYEAESNRMFSDEVFDAELPDFNAVNAFLLGLDLRELATNEDVKYIERFLERFLPVDKEDQEDDDFSARTFQAQIRALKRGFDRR